MSLIAVVTDELSRCSDRAEGRNTSDSRRRGERKGGGGYEGRVKHESSGRKGRNSFNDVKSWAKMSKREALAMADSNTAFLAAK